MHAKFILWLLLAFISSSAVAQQSQCDSLYIKVAGMGTSQLGQKKISIKADSFHQIKRVYLSTPTFQILRFKLGGCNYSNLFEFENEGAELTKNVQRFFSGFKPGYKVYLYDFELSGNLKCPNLALQIDVR